MRSSRKKRLLVDTNILLLYIVGSLNLDQIARHKRTEKFSVEDFRLLAGLLPQFGGIVVTPNILSEVSNLLGQTDERTKAKLFLLFGSLVRVIEEHYVRSLAAVELREFVRLGLTDATILALAGKELTVLTDDLHLYLALQSKGVEVINFNHLRDWQWKGR
jgi:rRNA-processing protein FCF1